MTDSPREIDWKARQNAVYAAKAEWLDKNEDHLKLIQHCLSSYWDEYEESELNRAADIFVSQAEDAIRSLISVVVDLRLQKHFIEQAKAKHPEAF